MARVGRARPATAAVMAFWLSSWAWQDGQAHPRSRVVLVRPTGADPVTLEALARVSGELAAAGFDIHVLPVNRDADARATVESAGRDINPVAAFAIFPGPPSVVGEATAEIWVSDRATGRATVQRLTVNPRDADRGAAVLAVHAVELLKASLAELWVEASTPSPADQQSTPTRSAAPAAGRKPSSDERPFVLAGLGVQAAAGVVAHAGGFSAGITPALRVSWGTGGAFAARLVLVGAGESLKISSAAGTARLRQQMAALEGVVSFRPSRAVQPIVLFTAGAYRLGVAGTGVPPFTDRSGESWAFVAGVGGGLVVRLSQHLAAVADLQALAFAPRPVVRIADAEVGQAGVPAMLLTVGVAGIL